MAGDLPDWTQAVNNPGAVLTTGPVGTGGSVTVPGAPAGSITVGVVGSVVNTPIVLSLTWYTDATQTSTVNTQIVTAVPLAGQTSGVFFESPAYGGSVKIGNLSGQPIQVTVSSASRVVNALKILFSGVPARQFLFSGTFAANVPITLTNTDSGSDAFASNGLTLVNVGYSAAGQLLVGFTNQAGVFQEIVVVNLPAPVATNVQIPLPQGMVKFLFIPTAAGAGQFIGVTAVAATP